MRHNLKYIKVCAFGNRYTCLTGIAWLNAISVFGLRVGKQTRNTLLNGLIQMYEDNQVEKYYNPSLLGNYNKRYTLFIGVIASPDHGGGAANRCGILSLRHRPILSYERTEHITHRIVKRYPRPGFARPADLDHRPV